MHGVGSNYFFCIFLPRKLDLCTVLEAQYISNNNIANRSELQALCRSPLLTSHKWRELVSSGRLVADAMAFFLWCYVCFVLLRFSSPCFR